MSCATCCQWRFLVSCLYPLRGAYVTTISIAIGEFCVAIVSFVILWPIRSMCCMCCFMSACSSMATPLSYIPICALFADSRFSMHPFRANSRSFGMCFSRIAAICALCLWSSCIMSFCFVCVPAWKSECFALFAFARRNIALKNIHGAIYCFVGRLSRFPDNCAIKCFWAQHYSYQKHSSRDMLMPSSSGYFVLVSCYLVGDRSSSLRFRRAPL